MSITQERKAELIKEYSTGEYDTGSPEVQVAILSERIGNLTEHLKEHKKRFPLASWPSDDGRSEAALAGLSQAQGSIAL